MAPERTVAARGIACTAILAVAGCHVIAPYEATAWPAPDAADAGAFDATASDVLTVMICAPGAFFGCQGTTLMRCNASGTAIESEECAPFPCNAMGQSCAQCDPQELPHCEGNELVGCSGAGERVRILCPEGCAGAGCASCADADGDGYGEGSGCAGLDCDDANRDAHVGADEICDDVDNDCDGEIDEGLQQTFYADADGDGAGGDQTLVDCAPPPGYVSNAGDCDDASALVFPGQAGYFTAPVHGSFDFNCDGQAEPQWSGRVSCVQQGTQCRLAAAGWATAIPACGQPGYWGQCTFKSFEGSLVCVGWALDVRPQPCR